MTTTHTLRTIAITGLLALVVLALSAFAAGTTSADPAQGLIPTIAQVCTDAPETISSDTCNAQPAGGDHETTVHPELSFCSDGLPALVARDGEVYGDQDGDGVLSGEDCNWT